jgi:glycerophosphoryl diester phosphodiesterase
VALVIGLCTAACGSEGNSVPFPGNEAFDLECPTGSHVANVPNFVVIGHRGSDGREVENTLPSMEAAIADGATAVETDLSMTKDGEVVLWHDWDPDTAIAIARQTGNETDVKYRPWVPDVGDDKRRPTDELTLAELREHYGYAPIDGDAKVSAVIPTFREFVAWASGRSELAYVLLDVKVPDDKSDLTNALLDVTESVLAAAPHRFQILYMSPYESVWHAISARIMNDGVSYDVDPGVLAVDAESCEDSSSRHALLRGGGHATTVHPAGWGHEDWKALKALVGCDVEARDTTRGSIPKVFASTIDQRDKMECLVDMGVDGLVTDNPALLADVARERARSPGE